MNDFNQIAIIGMGLMGGSIAFALKHFGYKGTIIGYDLSKESLQEAKDAGAIDLAIEDIGEAVSNVDLVIIATPVGYCKQIFQWIGPFLKKGVVLTDVGSVKGAVVEWAEQYLPPNIEFLGGHPMTGSEKGGIQAASPYLYENAYYFLTVTNRTSQPTLRRMETFINSLGAYPIMIDPYEHDRVVAQISHIPHLMAVMLVNMLYENKDISYLPFVGGGFRDTTRIASGNPNMWKDIFLLNKYEIMKGIHNIRGMLKEFYNILEKEDQTVIYKTLQRAKTLRDTIPSRLKDGMPPIYEIIVNVEDRPGMIGKLAQRIGEKGINIKEIEILHVREGENGAVKIGFSSEEDEKRAADLLKEDHYVFMYGKEQNK